MIKIGILGAPSTGKTTLAKALSSHVLDKYDVLAEYVDEYARGFVSEYGKPTVFDEYYFLERQLQKESIKSRAQFMICDSPIFLSLVYGSLVFDHKDPKEAFYFCEIQQRIVENLENYKVLVLIDAEACEPEADGMRLTISREEQLDIDKRIRAFCEMYGLVTLKVQGSLDERIGTICEFLESEKTLPKIRRRSNAAG